MFLGVRCLPLFLSLCLFLVSLSLSRALCGGGGGVYPQKPEEVIGFTADAVTSNCELADMGARN